MNAISWFYGSPAHAVRVKLCCRIFFGNKPTPSIHCLPGKCAPYRSKSCLMWAFSITPHCTAVGGINLLVGMHATPNGLAGVPRALSVCCAGIHLGFCVSVCSLPAAAEAISKSHRSHIKSQNSSQKMRSL